jgi:hypothetical protein
MKKIVFALVVLLFAAPVLATVTVTATVEPNTPYVVISYTSDGNMPRAFGLDITVSDGNIIACTPAMEGECTVSVRGFGIFPGTIDIDDQVTPPVVNTYGTPVAPAGARGALGGIDTNGITIEMGSLYEGPNAPPLSGDLCTIEVSAACTVSIAGNAARCGVEGSEAPGDAIGVVMEDPTEAVTITYVPGIVPEWVIDCFPSAHPDYLTWVDVGKPNSWCFPRQCHGDATGTEDGDPKLGYYWVQEGDLGVLITGWKQDGAALGDYVPGQAWIAADFNHTEDGDPKLGYYRVQEGDLGVLITYWKADPAAQGSDPAVPADCLDVP